MAVVVAGLTIDARDLGNVVRGSTHGGRQGSKTDGRGLSDDSVRDGSQSEGKSERDDHTQTSLSELRLGRLRHGGSDTESEQEGDVGSGTVEVDGSTTKVRAEYPRASDGDDLKTRGNQTEGEGKIGGHTRL